MLDYRMDTFLAVCRNMNYTKAAHELNITQPAVSQHIHFLEEAYQVRLFEFKGKRMILTREGQMLRQFAMEQKNDDMLFRQELSGAGKRKKLVFGATHTAGAFLMTKYISEFLKRNPSADIQMTVDNTETLLEQLNTGKLQFALVEGSFRRVAYDSLVYFRGNYICVCAAQDPFAKEVHRFEDLLEERLIVQNPKAATREILEQFLESRNMRIEEFSHVSEVSSIHTIKELVMDGCGIAFLYEAAVRRELESGLLRKVELEDFQITHDLTFVWRKGSIFADCYYDLFELFLDGNSPQREEEYGA